MSHAILACKNLLVKTTGMTVRGCGVKQLGNVSVEWSFMRKQII